jgi:hypothetical protein
MDELFNTTKNFREFLFQWLYVLPVAVVGQPQEVKSPTGVQDCLGAVLIVRLDRLAHLRVVDKGVVDAVH